MSDIVHVLVLNTVKPVLSGQPWDPRRFILQKIREEKLVFTEAGVHLMQGVCLIRGLLNTCFTVIRM